MTDRAASPRILVAGIGNIFLGDDAFGVEVAQRLLRRSWPANVRVEDFGIRGVDLVYALTDGYDSAILIDAVPRGGNPPGTLYLLEPLLDAEDDSPPLIEAHAMDPVKVLRTAAAMGGCTRQVFIVGCEPTPITSADEEGEQPMAMAPPVAAAVDEAVNMVVELVEKLSDSPSPDSQATGRREAQTWSH
ncbi:MAG TPA: hydrogenase maturation protease [Tepidisphaeraceae bacterium]|jgi:hydrogenase maturation protease|nr:hydrogenase maturation protease [Tepidisphaeraceae bacterium]